MLSGRISLGGLATPVQGNYKSSSLIAIKFYLTVELLSQPTHKL